MAGAGEGEMVRRREARRATAPQEPEAGRPSGASVPPTGSRNARPEAPAPGASASRHGRARKGSETGRIRTGASGVFGIRPNPVNVKLIYAAYLASLAIPFVALIGVFVAHQALKANPSAWLATHYVFQIRTFWIGLVANVIAYALSFAGVGLLLFPLIAVWVVARAVKGLIRVAHRAPVENPNGFFV